MDLGAYKPRPWPVYFRPHRTISGLLGVPDLPGPGIRQGVPVKVSGLVAQPWTMGDAPGSPSGPPGSSRLLVVTRTKATGDGAKGDAAA
jgi:hypothetical protein